MSTLVRSLNSLFFFFNDTATTEIYTLSLHDALPIYGGRGRQEPRRARTRVPPSQAPERAHPLLQAVYHWSDRKSTRLNSSHSQISYAVFCFKKKNEGTARSPKSSHASASRQKLLA